MKYTFLSTLSLRRATCRQQSRLRVFQISIHALLAESDHWQRGEFFKRKIFLSTLSLRRATPALHDIFELLAISIHALLAESDDCVQYCIRAPEISIHALLAESDGAILKLQCVLGNFYPRSPCGERLSDAPSSAP